MGRMHVEPTEVLCLMRHSESLYIFVPATITSSLSTINQQAIEIQIQCPPSPVILQSGYYTPQVPQQIRILLTRGVLPHWIR